MRQGGAAPTGKWQGSASGGVTAPDAIILPDSATRFAVTSMRLKILSAGHPMRQWLNFMAELAAAQHQAVMALGALPMPTADEIDAATGAGMPPLTTMSHRRAPAWRDGLARILDTMVLTELPAQAREVAARLRATPSGEVEHLAGQFLLRHVGIEEAGAVLYIAAALQAYLTALAGRLPVARLQLLPQRGLCPSCGSTPSAGLITATGKTPGARYLYCSLCSTAWNHVRATCITCGESRQILLESIAGDESAVKAETCGSCGSYSKLIYQKQDPQADPYADDLATLGLDILVAEAGWSRHAPNPLLLVGRGEAMADRLQ
jgi:FdhE protein